MADVPSDPPCIDSAPTEHSEPQAKREGGAGDAVGVDGRAEEGEIAGREDRLEPAGNNTVIYIYIYSFVIIARSTDSNLPVQEDAAPHHAAQLRQGKCTIFK